MHLQNIHFIMSLIVAVVMGALSHLKAESVRNFESVFPRSSKALLLRHMIKETVCIFQFTEYDQRGPKKQMLEQKIGLLVCHYQESLW